MALNYNQLASNLRLEYPGKYDNKKLWSDEALARRFISIDPSLKDYVTDWKSLYSEQESKVKSQQEDILTEEERLQRELQVQERAKQKADLQEQGLMPPEPTDPFSPRSEALNVDPEIPIEYENLVEMDPAVKQERAGHFKYIGYQFKEQFSGIPEWFIGSTAAFARAIEPVTSDRANVAGFADQLGAWAEEMREHSAQQTEDWLAESPDIAAYLKWIQDEPIRFRGDQANWWQGEIFARGLAQGAPTMTTLIGTELALWGLTGGVGGIINKARQGQKFLKGFQATSRLKKVQTGKRAVQMGQIGVYEAAGEYREAMEFLVDEQGMDPMAAQQIAAAASGVVGVINGVIEYLPLAHLKNRILGPNATREANSKIIRRVSEYLMSNKSIAKGIGNISESMITQGLMEGGQEWTQHMVQAITQYAYKNGYGEDPESAFEMFIREAASPQAVESAYSGFAIGTVTGVGGQAITDVLSAAQQRAVNKLTREDEITDIRYPEGVDLPGIEDEDITQRAEPVVEPVKDIKELSKNQLILRSFSGQGIDDLNRSDQGFIDGLTEQLGPPETSRTNPEVNEEWTNAIEDVLENEPETFKDIPDIDEFLGDVERELGGDLRTKIENELYPPDEEIIPDEEVPTPAVEEQPVIEEPLEIVEEAPPEVQEPPEALVIPEPEDPEIIEVRDTGIEEKLKRKPIKESLEIEAPPVEEVEPAPEEVEITEVKDVDLRKTLKGKTKGDFKFTVPTQGLLHPPNKPELAQEGYIWNYDETFETWKRERDPSVEVKEEAPGEAPPITKKVSDLHKHPARGNLNIARESQVKSLFKDIRSTANLVQDPKDENKFTKLINRAEVDYFANRHGDANAKVEQAIQMLHERAEFEFPHLKIQEDGSILTKSPGLAWGEEDRITVEAKEAPAEVPPIPVFHGTFDQGVPIIEQLTITPTPENTLTIATDQVELIQQLQKEEVPGADEINILESGRVEDYGKADQFIYDHFKDQYDYIKYEHQQLSEESRADEYIMLKEDYSKAVSVSAELADIHAQQGLARRKKVEVEKATKKEAENYVDEAIIDNATDENISETREGLDDIQTEDFKNIAHTSLKTNRALGIVLNKDVELKWHLSVHEGWENAEDWYMNTVEKYTGIQPGVLNSIPGSKDQLKLLYYSLLNLERTNQVKPANNDLNQAHIFFPHEMTIDERGRDIGKPKIPYITLKGNKNIISKKSNPSLTRTMASVRDTDLVIVSFKDMHDSNMYIDDPRSRITFEDRYNPMTANELAMLHYSEVNKGKHAFVLSREAGKLLFTKITFRHKDIASNGLKLKEYWENEGMNLEQMQQLVFDPKVPMKIELGGDIIHLNIKNLNASNIARYETLKRHFPGFLDDEKGMANVSKRIKIPLTPSIQVKDLRNLKVKVANKKNLSFVYPDKVVNAFQNGKYIGDGGTLTSKQFFIDTGLLIGLGNNSRVSKNVIAVNDGFGIFFGKHLMYMPQGNALLYENYDKDNEKLIGEIRNGNIYAIPNPVGWTEKSLDKYMEDNNLIEADSNRLIDFFIDDTADAQAITAGRNRLNSAIDSIYESEEGETLDQKLRFISAKKDLLKKLVRKLANRSGEMELIDHLMTTDEAKVFTNASKDVPGYADFVNTGETFEIPGESLGFIYGTETAHTKVKFDDQWHNYITDPILIEAFERLMINKAVFKIKDKFRLAYGSDSGKRIGAWVNSFRRQDIENVDNIMADMFEIGAGKHPGVAQLLDLLIQKRGILPAVQIANLPGISEKMQTDFQDILERNEVMPSVKNANVVYKAYMDDKGMNLKIDKAKRNISLEKINEWLADENTPDVFLFGYRSPTPHIHGAGMVRVHSLHNSSDATFMHPLDIMINYEADGDGDTFNMVQLPEELTNLYRELYESEEVKAQLSPINLDEYLGKDVKKHSFFKMNELFDLTAAFLAGKNAISEIASIQRTYGQINLVDWKINIGGTIVRSVKPGKMIKVDEMKPGKKLTTSDMLKTYLQAAVDNAKYLLLDKWGYSRQNIISKLWETDAGLPLNTYQLSIVNILHKLHGLNGKVKRGKDEELGIYNTRTMIIQSQKVLDFIENREKVLLNELGAKGYNVSVEFNNLVSSQESIASKPAIIYNSISRSNMDNSPFLFMGWDNIHQTNNVYKSVFNKIKEDFTVPELDILEKVVSEKDLKAGLDYANSMGLNLYSMFQDFQEKGTDPGFLGWSTNETMAKFATDWHNEFIKLSVDAKKIATFKFLNGVRRSNGKLVGYVFQVPPISKREKGITLLDSKIMEKYYTEFHKELNSEKYIDQDVIRGDSRHVGLVTHMLKNC